jgi:enterochelin esterase-like enzyme
MRISIAALVAFCISVSSSPAQTSRPDNLVSPDVQSDGRAIFRVRAPRASEVTINGDWMAPNTQEKMAKDDQGVWSITLGPLEPGIAIYSVTIDGITMADPVNPRMKIRARTSASLVEVPGDASVLWQARDVPHGTIEVNWEKSGVIGDTRAHYVYTPPAYNRDPAARYPVLYLLHGNNDTAAGWTDVGKANFILDNLIAEKKAVPMIVVMPFGHAAPFGTQGGQNNSLFERYLIEDVIAQVDRKYRVAAGRENRAIVGLSMGGGHSLLIGLGHLDLFSAVGAFSAAVPNDMETRFKALLDDSAGTNARLKLLWIGCGKQDGLMARSQALSELLKSHKIKHTMMETEGRHNYAVWRKYLAEVAPLLFK